MVVDIGPGVTQVKAGDHVVLHWRKGAGIHAKPAQYRWNGRTVNSGWVTTSVNTPSFRKTALRRSARMFPLRSPR